MKTFSRETGLLLTLVFWWGGAATVTAATPPYPAEATGSLNLWRPATDEVYLQEVGEKIASEQSIRAVAVLEGTLFAVRGEHLCRLEGSELKPEPGAPAKVRRLRSLGRALWAATEHGGAYRFDGKEWKQVSREPLVDFCLHLGVVHAASKDRLYRFAESQFVDATPENGYLSTDTTVIREDYSQVLADPVEIGPIQRIASYSETLYLLREGSLGLIDGRIFVPEPVDWGVLPSPQTRDLLAYGSRLIIGTGRGLGVLRGMHLELVRGEEGLCYEDVTCLAPGFEDDIWVGTSKGAIRWTRDGFHYFGAQHWLPGDQVNDIAVADHTVYLATDKGLGIVHYEPYTLAKKAAYFEREINDWGFKRLGFVHKLYWSDKEQGWLREISDNDGGHTSHYLTAMTFKYAVTGDEAAREEAVEAFNAMAWLADISPKPGFFARAVWSVQGDKGERSNRGSGGLPAKWYASPDGLWLWKGDTSSDEVNAHFFSVSIFHDLAAQGREKERAKAHLAKIAGHILENGWVLRDLDGEPTRWGRWDPAYLLRPYGYEARGLNGMEAQTYMQTAYALTGEEKFRAGLQQLLEWRYQTHTVRQRLTFPPDQVVPWDDELAFFCYYPLLRYTTEPELRSIYRRSLERTWEVLRRQEIPFYNYVYGALTGNDCETEAAARHLREWSLNLVNETYHNSHRRDLGTTAPHQMFMGGRRAISPRESESKMDVRYPLQYDGGEGGRAVTPPAGWLEDYWMGRYFGFIKPAATSASDAGAPPPCQPHPRALPYAGPPRPAAP